MGLFRESPDLLHHMTTQVSPSLLFSKLFCSADVDCSHCSASFVENGVHVYKAQHEAGTFIVTFPRAYHAGFSYGVRRTQRCRVAIIVILSLCSLMSGRL